MAARGRVRGVSGHQRVLLDQGWEVASGSIGGPDELDRLTWHPAVVPGTAAGALRAAGLWSWDTPRRFDAEEWWWRTRFAGDRRAVLGLDGLATLADVWLNGAPIVASDNMFRAHELPVELRGDNQLVIRCRALEPHLAVKRPRPRWRVPMLEEQQLRWVRTTLLGRTPGWSPPAAAVGPWRPVWLEQWSGPTVGDVAVASRLEGNSGIVEVAAVLGEGVDAASLIVARGGERVVGGLAHDAGRWRGSAAIPAPALWWPHTHGEPACYAISIETRGPGGPATVDLGSTGFRTVTLDRDDGDFAVRINGVRVFCRGACWTPLDAVTLGATPEAYRAAVAQVRAAGMNMIRVGGMMIYEADELYDALDAAGVLLWQDLMFANMDYPEDPAFIANVTAEVDQQTARLQARPCLAIVCGNSEGEQQAAMWGAPRERWAPPLFHEVLPAIVRDRLPGTPYTPSSAHGGAFPHAANAGPSSYYGVGAYLRPLEDARRAEVRFASECLAFANIPAPGGLPVGAALRVHHPLWKRRSPRDLGAGWDFDDVRDHYVARLFGVDPVALRIVDHERYLALGRAATGEVMAQVFAEWRRARSTCRGGLIWFLRDLWPGAGWGVVDAHGAPKPCWHALRRALAPVALAITDEGVNGLAIHAVNDRAAPIAARLDLVLYRAGEIVVGHGGADVTIPAHGAVELPAAALFDDFLDLSFAYRFGPPTAQVLHATLEAAGAPLGEAFWFPAGMPSALELDIGLAAALAGDELTVRTRRFAQSVSIDAHNALPDDDGFHLAPGQSRTVTLRRTGPGPLSGAVTALNSEVGARFESRP